MYKPNFNDSQFLDATSLNAAAALPASDLAGAVAVLHTPGIMSAAQMSLSSSGLVVTVNTNAAPDSINGTPVRAFGAAFVFGSGVVCIGAGTTAGAATSTYSCSAAAFVPSSGSATVYLAATPFSLQQTPFVVLGPPPGHPDYDPSFVPYTGYRELVDSVSIAATTVPPDNVNALEIARFQVSAGQTSIPVLDTSHQARAGARLSRSGEVLTADLAPTGISAGTYKRARGFAFGVDGRVTGVIDSAPGISAFLQPGFFSYTAPPGTYYVEATVTGGGGGGGGCDGHYVGGGGGAGGTVVAIVPVTPGQVLVGQVGSSGVGGDPGQNGTPGGSSGFAAAAYGGAAGASGASPAGGAGGTFSLPGDLQGYGSAGGDGTDGTHDSTGTTYMRGGDGGGGCYGGGGRAATTGGGFGRAIGSGGGGAYFQSGFGGSGSPGAVIIRPLN